MPTGMGEGCAYNLKSFFGPTRTKIVNSDDLSAFLAIIQVKIANT